MAELSQTNAEDCRTLAEVLQQLTTEQIRFVVARLECSSDRETAAALGISESAVYHWPNLDAVRQAVRLMALDGLTTALHLRRRNLAKAMLRKVAGLDSDDERVQQSAATEIIEWELGKAKQAIEHSGELEIDSDSTTDDRRIATILALYDRLRARVSESGTEAGGVVDSPTGAAD